MDNDSPKANIMLTLKIQEMAKRFSPEFKQQAIECVLANSHEPLAAIVRKLGVGDLCLKTGGFNLVNYTYSLGVYHEQETEDLHRRI